MNAALDLLRRLRRAVLDRVFERSGETSEAVRLDELGLAREGYHDYEPSGWRSFRRAMRGVKVSAADTFLDIGCGKGRVVVQAARRPFGRVLGVELSDELAAQAQELADAERDRQRCGSVEIVAADITTWPVPDDVTVIYVYNALSGDALVAMLDRIAESASRVPPAVADALRQPAQRAHRDRASSLRAAQASRQQALGTDRSAPCLRLRHPLRWLSEGVR